MLRKAGIKFKEEHLPDHYILDFGLSNGNNSLRNYEMKIEYNTSKILHYVKTKDKRKLIEIDNIILTYGLDKKMITSDDLGTLASTNIVHLDHKNKQIVHH